MGLMALLDDVAAIAKVAAASLDDVALHTARAGSKSAGVVIDDAAVAPSYVVGFAADREIPIVAKIARGSLFNKLVILLPAALVLSFFAPWAITPLLMLGGLYLSYEGAEKVLHALFPERAHGHEAKVSATPPDPEALEAQKVKGAIRTDFILSAEIMAIALASVPDAGLVTQGVVLAVVGIGITLGVYLAVALIVKADDLGLAMAALEADSSLGRLSRVFGRGLVKAMPGFLKLLATVGTAAMVWVGGGILVHGLEHYGLGAIAHGIEHAAHATKEAVPLLSDTFGWLITALGSGLVGLVVGAMLIPLVGGVLAPAWKAVFQRAG
jgi:hypothetical protein